MLKYFIHKRSIKEINDIIYLLNKKKKRLSCYDFSNPYEEYDKSRKLFDTILNIAINKSDENLANAQYIFKLYFYLFCCLSEYFTMLQCKRYRDSWSKLQDCFDIIQVINNYTSIENALEVQQIQHMLLSYETLYPFNLFISAGYIVEKSHCSICGASMLGLCCPHVKGKLYWGKMAQEVIDKVKKIEEVSIVENPDDKRCVLELSDKNGYEFKKIEEFLKIGHPFLQDFSIEKRIEYRLKTNIKIVGRNDLCPCGSGLKFKKCCGKELYYKHEKLNIIALKRISLIYN